MALLLDRRSLSHPPGMMAADLADRIAAVEAEQKHLVPEGSYDIGAYRVWFDEFARVVTNGIVPHAIPVSQRFFSSPAGPVATRIYTPRGYRSVIVFAHGGGWVIGNADTHDHICRWLAVETGSKVVSVDYGLAPEHPYPAAIEQMSAALAAIVAEHKGDDRTIFVGGDSAGANVAAMGLLSAGPEVARAIAGFLSIYGAYSPQMNLSSHKLYGDGRFGLSDAQMRWFWNLYAPQVPPEDRDRLSPLGADLSFFPPTLCVGAECDLLLDDTLGFYSSLAKAGVDVSLSLWPGMTHGALHFVEIVNSVTTVANSIVHYVEHRRHSLGKVHPAGSVSLARVLQQEPLAGLAATVTASREAGSDLDRVPFVPIDASFLTSRSRLHGSVAHKLAADIIRGDIQPGSLLPNEDDASASFGVSRSAYREAIRTLAAKGLVTATPKIGTRIAPRAGWRLLDPDVLAWHFETNCTAPFVRSLFEMRKVVEPSAAALTAMRRTDEDLSELTDSLERMARLDPRGVGWQNAVLGFHEVILRCCQNELLAATWPAIQVTMQWSIALQMSQSNLRLVGDPVADHAKVFERIAAQSAEGALQEMAFLIDAALADTIANLQRVPSPRSSSITPA